jgi:hypothetical protein
MKKLLNAFWEFLVAWGEHRYEVAKRHGHGYQGY